ncbi:MAG: UvrD-helicase domain-containing protein [Haliea sp.]|nr:UvrD-helicase domain-containing protein [Haliea sp.]
MAGQVIWVGDIKQSIYGFRGSDPTLMAAVVQRVTEDGNAPEILEKSWRSTPALVASSITCSCPPSPTRWRPRMLR